MRYRHTDREFEKRCSLIVFSLCGQSCVMRNINSARVFGLVIKKEKSSCSHKRVPLKFIQPMNGLYEEDPAWGELFHID